MFFSKWLRASTDTSTIPTTTLCIVGRCVSGSFAFGTTPSTSGFVLDTPYPEWHLPEGFVREKIVRERLEAREQAENMRQA
jgi:hypothetical protein